MTQGGTFFDVAFFYNNKRGDKFDMQQHLKTVYLANFTSFSSFKRTLEHVAFKLILLCHD